MSNENKKSNDINKGGYEVNESKKVGCVNKHSLDVIESKLIKICQQILKIEDINLNDKFIDLGGNSLKIIELECAIENEFNVELAISEIFNMPTIKEIADHIGKADKNTFLSISPVEDREYYPASWAQKGIFLLGQHKLSGTSFNMNYIKVIEGAIDIEKFRQSLKLLVLRHEAFRTSFELLNDELIQKISENVDFEMDYMETEEGLEREIIKEFMKPFDLQKAPLFRAALIKVAEKKYILVLITHHIVFDGSSFNILLKDINRLYYGQKLTDINIQYKDFSVWQNHLLSGDRLEDKRRYWAERLSGNISVLSMPYDFSKKNNQSFKYASKKFIISNDIMGKLGQYAKEKNTTMFIVIISIYSILLAKYSGEEDIIIGTLSAGRNHTGLGNIVGMFVNTLAIRNNVQLNKTFSNFLEETKDNVLKDYENQDYPFDIMIDNIFKNIPIERKDSVNPLFDTMLVFHNEIKSLNEEMMSECLNIKDYNNNLNLNKDSNGLDIYLDMFLEQDNQISGLLSYNANLFKESTISMFITHFTNIASQVAENPSIKLSDIDILSKEEKNKILFEFTTTKVEYPLNKTVYELFEEHVEKNPENIAAIFENKTLTYRELNDKSNQLAGYLRNIGIKPNEIICIMVERSFEMIIGLMGILKAGGAYLPIEPSYPEERVKYLLENSKSDIIITQKKYEQIANLGSKVVFIEDSSIYIGRADNLCMVNSSEDLAYTIYTSGSTGNPKGVMITHKAVVNTICDINRKFDINKKDRIIGLSSVSFDLSVYDIFGALTAGASIVLIQDQRNIGEIIEVLKNKNITIWNSVPAIIDMLVKNICDEFENTSLRLVMLSGDWIPLKLPENIKRFFINSEVISLGGATEASIWSIYYPIVEVKEQWNSIPYGNPLSNQTFYVLDRGMQLCPYGVPGELYIGGIGLAKGYMNDPEKTAYSFIDHPQFGNLYKTGDWGRFHKDGYIEFLGRRDHQIKIRGFRIELGEIETQLLNINSIKEVVVLHRRDTEGNEYLCAYFVSNDEFDASILKEYLLGVLPEYMIPSYFVKLKIIPLTLNGKIDRMALPEPDKNSIIKIDKYIAPRNKIEKDITRIWEEILCLDNIGIDDNFFSLGGHSLKAITTTLKIQKELNVDISVSELFRTPTIRKIAEYISNAENFAYSDIDLLEKKDYYPASFAQKRLYVANQMDAKGTSYNIPVPIRVEGSFDRERVEAVFKQLLERHESLRTAMKIVDGEIVQKIYDQVDFNLFYAEADENEIDDIIKGLIAPFDLSAAPLIRVGLIRVSEFVHILFIDVHHIVSDGISIDTVLREFFNLYEGNELPRLRVQYKEFASWQNKLFETGIIKKQESYWLSALSGEIISINIPTDFPRPHTKSFEGDKIKFYIDEELVEDLRKLAAETGTTLYMVLMAAYNVLLAHYTCQDDILIGTPIAGRSHPDLENVIGMFVNTLVIRNYPNGDKYFLEFLDEVKENVLKAYDNQDYPLEMLMDKLKLDNKDGINHLYDVVFAFQAVKNNNTIEKKLKLSDYQYNYKIAKFDINLSGREFKTGIVFELEYCTKIFKEDTMKKFIDYYIRVLQSVTSTKNIKIKEVELENINFNNIDIEEIEFNF